MNLGPSAVALALVCANTVVGAPVVAASCFSAGGENWSVQNGADSCQWLAGGSDPGGHIRGSEVAELSGPVVLLRACGLPG
jgi:hypothetical protein